LVKNGHIGLGYDSLVFKLWIVGLMVNLKMVQIENEFILIIVVWFTIVCELVHLKIGIKSRVNLQIATVGSGNLSYCGLLAVQIEYC